MIPASSLVLTIHLLLYQHNMPYLVLRESSHPYLIPLFLIFLSATISLSIFILTRLLTILYRPRPTNLTWTRPPASSIHPTHLLIVLGSGGHTAEMLDLLRRLPFLPAKFTCRTYLVSSGDGFSALKAKEFEMELLARQAEVSNRGEEEGREGMTDRYNIVTVRRARHVHQSLFSTPWSASLCLWDCITVLKGRRPLPPTLAPAQQFNVGTPTYPDLILTNGPGTGVCVVLASLILLFFGFSGRPPTSSDDNVRHRPNEQPQWRHSGQMRTIFVESWARVKTLSLSGKILLPVVNRFLVQWPALEGRGGGKAEFVGPLVG